MLKELAKFIEQHDLSFGALGVDHNVVSADVPSMQDLQAWAKAIEHFEVHFGGLKCVVVSGDVAGVGRVEASADGDITDWQAASRPTLAERLQDLADSATRKNGNHFNAGRSVAYNHAAALARDFEASPHRRPQVGDDVRINIPNDLAFHRRVGVLVATEWTGEPMHRVEFSDGVRCWFQSRQVEVIDR